MILVQAVRVHILGTAREHIRALADLVLPVGCAGCDAPGVAWCPRCAALLGEPVRVYPPSCSADLTVYALGDYQGRLRVALLAYKERGRRELAAPLGGALATALRTLIHPHPGGGVVSPGSGGGVVSPGSGGGVVSPGSGGRLISPGSGGGLWLVPVPSRWSAAARRGGQHVALLAEHAAAALADAGIAAAVAPALRMARGVRDSVGLDRTARHLNLAGRILVRSAGLPPPGTPVVLLDDVVTTGTTTATCVAALLQAGVEVPAIVALAAVVRHARS